MICPRCLSTNIVQRSCCVCRIAYDSDRAFNEKVLKHWEIRARWNHWRSQNRTENERKRVSTFLGNG